jgi:hypothetical protein
MALITDISQIQAIQDAHDQKCADMVASVTASHAEESPDLTPRPQKLIGTGDGGTCADCGDATYMIRDQVSGRTTSKCRDCINAVRRQTIQHAQYGGLSLCYQ